MKIKTQKTFPKNYYATYPQITYSSKEYQNNEYNENMEDIIYIDPKFNGGHHKGLFSIYDGHGGIKSAKITSEIFPKIFLKNLTEIKPKNIEKSLINSYKIIDSQLKNENCFKEGNTATIIYIEYNNLFCSNVGDSSCVIISKFKAEKISYDHLCNDINEKKRILKIGNFLESNRLEGILNLSRSLGDFNLKKSGLISLPYIRKYCLSNNDKFCIIASDGVWDVISLDLIFELSKKIKFCNELCDLIINEAINRGSKDNISCIVIEFNWKY